METYLSSIYVCILTHTYCILMRNVFLTVDQGQIFLKTTSLNKTRFQSPHPKAHVTVILSFKEARQELIRNSILFPTGQW